LRLEDDVIALRPFVEGDAPRLAAALHGDPEIDRWRRIPSPYTEEHAREFITSTEEKAFGIFDREDGELLGGIGARVYDEGVVDIGYWVRAEARGRGVATRALVLVARFAVKELDAERVQLTTDPSNAASQRVAEKAGFRREGILRSLHEIKGRRRDAVMFSLLPNELV
jgi:[ribosomal protein S5]-alanine N-acetyltransferase